jgi:hypothetical protein
MLDRDYMNWIDLILGIVQFHAFVVKKMKIKCVNYRNKYKKLTDETIVPNP